MNAPDDAATAEAKKMPDLFISPALKIVEEEDNGRDKKIKIRPKTTRPDGIPEGSAGSRYQKTDPFDPSLGLPLARLHAFARLPVVPALYARSHN